MKGLIIHNKQHFSVLFFLTLLVSQQVFPSVPIDGTYIVNQPILPNGISGIEIDIQNNQVVGARGGILQSSCSSQGQISGGVILDFGQLYNFQGFLSTILTLDEGKFIFAESVNVNQNGEILGIRPGSFRGVYAELDFNTDSEATISIYSAYTYFSGNGIKSESCLSENQYPVSLAE